MSAVLLSGATVLDDRGPRPDGTVVRVEGDRITHVGPRGEVPDADVEVAAPDHTVVPGLVNAHAHLALSGDEEPYASKLPRLKAMDDAALITLQLEQATRNLLAGVTTVRDLHPGPGGTVTGLQVLRSGLNSQEFVGCRLVHAFRPLVTPGGHGSHWLSRAVSGVDEVKRAVRETFAEGADVVKFMTAHSWGPLPDHPATHARYHTPEELRAGVEVAHRLGLPVAAHSHGPECIEENLDAGVDSIEHGSGLTQELAERMAATGTFLVPTLASYANFAAVGADRGERPERVAQARYVSELQQAGVAAAIAAGVRIVAGTDGGFQYLPHGGTIVDELVLYTELGMSPVQALASATRLGAELVGRSHDLGRLEPGYLADLVVVRGAVHDDVAALRDVVLVMREGTVRRDELTEHGRRPAAWRG